MELSKLREVARKISEEKYKENSSKRLRIIMEKKFKTTMIGALARFEEGFGKLWGYNKKESLTLEELEWFAIWESVRTEILNNGNNQVRSMIEELQQYTINWNRYQTTLIVKKD